MPPRALSDEDFKDWRVCWKVNVAFSTLFDNQEITTCMKCGAEIPPDTLPHRSSFVSRVVESSCSHVGAGSLCSDCDVDMVFNITRGEETCFDHGCDEILSVDRSLISTALLKLPQLLAEYAILFEVQFVTLLLNYTLATSRFSVASVLFVENQ
jgi:predicted nucleic acid-binding Zn ribbon protein